MKLLTCAAIMAVLAMSFGTAAFADIFEVVSFGAPFQNTDGEWVYQYDISWDLSKGLSHWDLVLDCENIMEIFRSATPNGEALLDDPSIDGNQGPLIKWDYGFEEKRGHTEGGFFTLITITPPRPGDPQHYEDAAIVKYGQNYLYGHLDGYMPSCEVPEPATMSLLGLAGLGILRRLRK